MINDAFAFERARLFAFERARLFAYERARLFAYERARFPFGEAKPPGIHTVVRAEGGKKHRPIGGAVVSLSLRRSYV